MDLKNKLNEKFVYVDEVAEILEIGFLTGKNVFLYGKGGHAKSEIIQEFLKYVDEEGIESFIQACGEGLTEDKLFGGINMKKFQKTGEIEHLVENSFMNKKYVVFEELLDSRMNVLLSLKDILTSGIFRQGKQQFKIRTEFIICLTNRTKQEVSEDNSIKALLERFPLEIKVEWPSYQKADYEGMFRKVLKKSYTDVAQICHLINESGDFVSPRTAIHMAQVFEVTNDLCHLKYFGATSDIIDKIERARKEKLLNEFLGRAELKYNVSIGKITTDTIIMRDVSKELQLLLTEISSQTYPESIFPRFARMKDNIENKIKDLRESIVNTFMND